jgi:hypothetical protein
MDCLCILCRRTAAASRNPVTLEDFLHLISETTCAIMMGGGVVTGITASIVAFSNRILSFAGGKSILDTAAEEVPVGTGECEPCKSQIQISKALIMTHPDTKRIKHVDALINFGLEETFGTVGITIAKE